MPNTVDYPRCLSQPLQCSPVVCPILWTIPGAYLNHSSVVQLCAQYCGLSQAPISTTPVQSSCVPNTVDYPRCLSQPLQYSPAVCPILWTIPGAYLNHSSIVQLCAQYCGLSQAPISTTPVQSSCVPNTVDYPRRLTSVQSNDTWTVLGLTFSRHQT